VKTNEISERKLQEQLLLSRRVEGDRLMLADSVLLAAIDGSRHLTAGERAALEASPLTLRRLRTLALEQRRASGAWSGSHGMLRAAADGHALSVLDTDDGHWHLHFVRNDGAWRVILVLDAAAPYAARLLSQQTMLRVVDGGGAVVLQGALDTDGECEGSWPFAMAPALHFHEFGARFGVEPVPS
jgi:hypothetical protein